MNPYEAPAAQVADRTPAPLGRPWYVTGWLWFMIAANALSAISYFLFGDAVLRSLPQMSKTAILLLGAACIANVCFSVAILRWRKWGVWGYCATGAGAFVYNAIYLGLTSALMGMIGVAVLLVLLNIGGERRVWPRLTNW